MNADPYAEAACLPQTVKDAAWYYPQTKAAADNIKDCIAFYTSKVKVGY